MTGMDMSPKKVILIGIDSSDQSLYSLEWTLDHLIILGGGESHFKIILIHVRAPALSVVRFSGAGSGDVLTMVESNLKKAAEATINRATEICNMRSGFDFQSVVIEGDPRHALCEVVEKYHANILVIGSHGHGVFKRAILGTVSDYCAHHAHCSVMIVKRPKSHH